VRRVRGHRDEVDARAREPIDGGGQVFDKRRAIAGDEAERALDVEAVDDDRRRGARLRLLPYSENAAVVVDCRFGPESTDEADACCGQRVEGCG
jgi:hypothetical protein